MPCLYPGLFSCPPSPGQGVTLVSEMWREVQGKGRQRANLIVGDNLRKDLSPEWTEEFYRWRPVRKTVQAKGAT